MTSPNPMALEAKALPFAKVSTGNYPEAWFPWLSGDMPNLYATDKIRVNLANGVCSNSFIMADRHRDFWSQEGEWRPVAILVRISDGDLIKRMEALTGYALPPPAAGEGLTPENSDWIEDAGPVARDGPASHAGEGLESVADDPALPCDVSLPPNTVFRAGVHLSALLVGLRVRGMATPVARVAVLSDGQFELLRQLAKADLRNAAMTVPPAEAANLNALLRNGYAEFDSAGRLGSPFFGVTEAGRAALKEKT